MQVPALSKINLFLKVTAKREDGFHELKTLFLPLEQPCDELLLQESAGGFALTCDNPEIPSGTDNLAGRAAMLYSEKSGIAPDWSAHIIKRIPVAAGMGGGSSDAAAMLEALNSQYGCFSASQLSEMALTLGADVPFFLSKKTGFATGVGEKLIPFDFETPEIPLLLVNPRFPVSAKWAYTHLDRKRIGTEDGGKAQRITEAMRRGNIAGIADNIHNDLAFALYEKFPLLRELRDFMCANGALNADITGSGPTLYAICPQLSDCEELAHKLKSKFGDSLYIFSGKTCRNSLDGRGKTE